MNRVDRICRGQDCREADLVRVKIPADLSSSDKEHWKYAQIDWCIAPIVDALQNAGIDMRGSCCGHGEREGHIHLQDGRSFLILDAETTQKYLSEVGSKSWMENLIL